MKKHLLALVTITLMTGCAPNINPSTLSYGAKPSNYLEIVERFEMKAARDPESIIIRERQPLRKQYVWRRLMGDEVKAGWGVCFDVNGKNAYGGYAGYEPRFALINSGFIAYYAYGNEAVNLCSANPS